MKAHPYSPTEERVLAAIGVGKVSSVDLIEAVWDEPPVNARQALLAIIKVLTDKVERNDEPFRIMRSERNGPKPIFFWRTKAPKKGTS